MEIWGRDIVPIVHIEHPEIVHIERCSAIVARDLAHKVYHSLMDPKNVSDIFGKRIGKRFVAIQVTITNPNKEFQYLIHDVSLDVSGVVDGWEEAGKAAQLSSRELSILRGVAEKGQVLDFRNLLLRILRGVGTVAAGALALPVLGVGGSWAAGVALYNGAFLTAYATTFPDFSISQLVRLDDSAYVANSVIPRQQARVIVAFMPQRLFMDKAHRKKFWKEPTSVFDHGVDFRKIHVIVDGEHVMNVADIPPVVVGAIIEPNEMKKFADPKLEVKGYILGRFLAGATITIENENPPGAVFGGIAIALAMKARTGKYIKPGTG